MIPQNVILGTVEQLEQQSLTYRIDFKNKRISGKVDGFEACKQALLKILLTERYSSVIYTSSYGVELETLVGVNIPLVRTDIERRLKEALEIDDRFISIKNFSSTVNSMNELTVSFTVETIYGAINIEQPVAI